MNYVFMIMNEEVVFEYGNNCSNSTAYRVHVLDSVLLVVAV